MSATSSTDINMPTFRRDLNVGTALTLPPWSTGPLGDDGVPRNDDRVVVEAAREAGYQGIQGVAPELCHEFGLVPGALDLHPQVGGLLERARVWADQGFACCTLFLGTGLEGDDDASRLVEEVLVASGTTGIHSSWRRTARP